MVLHTHMLNPRIFLEDCMRSGLRRLWQNGMPWDLLNKVIDTRFSYDVADDIKASWVAATGRSWDNRDDGPYKKTKCPSCTMAIDIPWTTCDMDEVSKISTRPGLTGSGYGDGKLSHACPACHVPITKDLLCVAKFVRDSTDLLVKDIPMPGTILDAKSGIPEVYARRAFTYDPMTFPNRMIKYVLRVDMMEVMKNTTGTQEPSMDTIKGMVEKTLASSMALRVIAGGPGNSRSIGSTKLSPTSRIAIRKMMSRYRDNFGSFGLELSSAIMRQGIFSQKMYKLDWLHSPAARETMARLCKKYQRFIEIMAKNPRNVAVPTLDVDLAWHTHQLAPSAYYDFTVGKTAQFIDHDDKIADNKLDEGFEWTSKAYQEEFGEVYSECTCWYCETVRSTHVSSIGKVMKLSKNEKGKSCQIHDHTL